ncbi:MAG: hypothetical protein B7Z51_06985 [Methyloversatilis sp. 12-65-5]|nr:MAG: hypothetical protein B7Z51_06985 [Methyloversatilis sp. 12-65-5]
MPVRLGEGAAKSADGQVVAPRQRRHVGKAQLLERAARLIEQMEKSGLVSPMNATGGREVLAPVREE